MVRGPAKPIRAPGSAMMQSPSIAKLAETPPVVGSVKTEMKSPPASSNLATAAEVFAIWPSETTPSCILAPPEQLTTTKGSFSSIAISTAAQNFSPTTKPIEPIRKFGSITAKIRPLPFINAFPISIASLAPDFFSSSFIRCL